MRRIKPLYSGIASVLAFWLTTIICSVIMGNYDHFSRMVSELGALGTNTQTLFTIGLVVSGLLSVVFVIQLVKRCRRLGLNVLPIIVILTMSFSIIGAALFPMPLRLHGLLGIPSILLISSPLLSLILWRNVVNTRELKWMAAISFVMMALGFLVYSPNLLEGLIGLKQRFFHAGWSLWYLSLSILLKPDDDGTS